MNEFTTGVLGGHSTKRCVRCGGSFGAGGAYYRYLESPYFWCESCWGANAPGWPVCSECGRDTLILHHETNTMVCERRAGGCGRWLA